MSFHPIPGSTFTFYLPGLEDQANAGLWKSSPTIAAADFTISVNGGAFEALDNTPTVKPTGGTQIEFVLSAAETTAAGEGGSITVNCVDAAGAEWYSVGITLRVGTPAVNVTMQQGVAVAPADANGNVRVVLYGTQDAVTFGKITLDSRGYQPALQLVSPLPNAIYGATGLMVGLTSSGVAQVTTAVPDAQDIADALLLAPSGAAAAGSAMAELAAILEDTGTTLPAAIAVAAANLDTQLATLALEATAQAILADSNELQTDWANGGRLDVILDAAAAGGGLDAAGVRAAVGLAAANLDMQLGDIQDTVDQLDDIFIYTLTTDGTTPIRDALVQAFSDEAMTTIVDYGITDNYGKVRLHLKEPGTYYLHRTKVGVSFVNPDNETIP